MEFLISLLFVLELFFFVAVGIIKREYVNLLTEGNKRLNEMTETVWALVSTWSFEGNYFIAFTLQINNQSNFPLNKQNKEINKIKSRKKIDFFSTTRKGRHREFCGAKQSSATNPFFHLTTMPHRFVFYVDPTSPFVLVSFLGISLLFTIPIKHQFLAKLKWNT